MIDVVTNIKLTNTVKGFALALINECKKDDADGPAMAMYVLNCFNTEMLRVSMGAQCPTASLFADKLMQSFTGNEDSENEYYNKELYTHLYTKDTLARMKECLGDAMSNIDGKWKELVDSDVDRISNAVESILSSNVALHMGKVVLDNRELWDEDYYTNCVADGIVNGYVISAVGNLDDNNFSSFIAALYNKAGHEKDNYIEITDHVYMYHAGDLANRIQNNVNNCVYRMLKICKKDVGLE